MEDKKIKVAIIGCGSVSTQYLPHLSKAKFIEIVSVCNLITELAVTRSKEYNVPNYYPHINQLLAGAPFNMIITPTDMQEHGMLNKLALEAGKHVWSEKPMANTYKEVKSLLDFARSKNLRFRGVPAVAAALLMAIDMLFICFKIGNGKFWYEDQYPFIFALLALVFFFTGYVEWGADAISLKNNLS